ncbi:SpdD-like protein [Streptomyces sp. NPDC058301]|uniref:SpdD-like protein n=1 Tax=Streptomyces sp. NPDC058301 TaxID=3346436 RepID=UPI0036EF5A84
MIRPKVPVNPLPTGLVTPMAPAIHEHHTQAPVCSCQHPAPTVVAQSTAPASGSPVVDLVKRHPVLIVGGLAVGATLAIAMFLAIALVAVAVPIGALTVRSLLNTSGKDRR